MSTATDHYIAKRSELLLAIQKVEQIFSKITALSQLQFAAGWKKLQVSNATIGLPAEMTFGTGPTLNAGDWPTGDQIAAAIARWHEARREARSAHLVLNQAERDTMLPLPD